ncbi:MAG: hypothetical protein BGO43_11520 [Gammaproteobacteria bacterium 39-13]|nr:DUF3800 domain-containing protein [Gammaproteobacteria bacterium]OJV85258.1 MAG: hypothetical protein BGO43_11520 [Gammaproteobacteria bacterium 39-13]
MLEAYIDDSALENYYVLAGYIASSENWKIIEKNWQTLLDQYNMTVFKLRNEVTSGAKRKRCEKFYRIIEENVICAISVMVSKRDLTEVVNEVIPPPNVTDWNKLNNPYYFALRALVQHVNINLEKLGIDEHVKFIFDYQTEAIHLKENWKYMYESVTEDLRKLLDREPIFMNDNEKLALQTADMWAGFVRKWAAQGLDEPVKNLDFRAIKFNWDPKKDLLRAHISITKEDIMKEFLKAKDIHISRYLSYRFS